MHPQSRNRVDFHDDSALLLQRPPNVLDHDIHAGQIQAHHPRRLDGPGGHLRMHLIGHVLGRPARAQVSIAANQHDLSGSRNRLRRVPLFLQYGLPHAVNFDLAETGGVSVGPPRIFVRQGDQFGHRAMAVTDHLSRRTRAAATTRFPTTNSR